MTLPSQANAVLTASGYAVASRKAAVGSRNGTAHLAGSRGGFPCQARGEIIGRLEAVDCSGCTRTSAGIGCGRSGDDARKWSGRIDERRFEIIHREKKFSTRSSSRIFGRSSPMRKQHFKQAEAQVHTQEANVQLAQKGVQAAQVQVEFTNIRAPFDGTVLTKDADVGDIITPFGAAAGSRADIVSLADMSSIDAEVDVSEDRIWNRCMSGSPAKFRSMRIPERQYRGVVHMIVPTADRSKATVLTKVDFLDKDARVLPDMSLKVQFLKDSTTVDSSGPKLTVPATAIVSRGSGKIVAFDYRWRSCRRTPGHARRIGRQRTRSEIGIERWR